MGGVLGDDSVVGKVLERVSYLGSLHEGFCGDASDIDAGASDPFFFDQSDVLPSVCHLRGEGFSPFTGADYK